MLFLVYLYLGAVLLLSIYGFHRSTMIGRLLGPGALKVGTTEINEYPKVCVQIPLYNESKVAERVIRAVAALEYPAEKLSIQILDDSTDSTVEIVNSVVSDLSVEAEVIRRKERTGFKAGALKVGLAKTDAEFIAIFDADFVPDPDFLLKTIPYFHKDNRTAFVQTRWGHLNREHSLFTRGQALLIDGHFIIEHASRFKQGAFFNFNGTAGVWRKEAILDAGNWQGDTLTEDLDLSYRAQLKGWRGVYLKDYVCFAELPETVSAFKSQQYRWTKGTAQVCKKLLWPILRSEFPLRVKIEAFFHLTANFCYILMALTALLLVPIAVYRASIYFAVGAWFELFVFFFATCSVGFFYFFSQWFQKRKTSALEILAAITLGGGMAAHCAIASISGLRSNVGTFVRTPKRGSLYTVQTRAVLSDLIQHRNEAIFLVYLALGVVYLFVYSHFMTIPFVLLLLGGYLNVLYSAVRDPE